MNDTTAAKRRVAPLDTPDGLGDNATKDISAALTTLLADMFALYLKTKNFHWHISGPAFPRLPPAARRAGRTDLSPPPTRSPNASASLAVHAALDRPYRPPAAHRGQRRRLRDPARHARRAREDNLQLTGTCARRTACATNTATSRPPACWKNGSTRRTARLVPVRIDAADGELSGAAAIAAPAQVRSWVGAFSPSASSPSRNTRRPPLRRSGTLKTAILGRLRGRRVGAVACVLSAGDGGAN